MARVVSDCRSSPNIAGCTLAISGEEDEVLACAVDHAVAVHGHERTDALREEIRGTLMAEEDILPTRGAPMEAGEPASWH